MADKKLTINWILPRPSLSGGVKSNRLIAEAMVRRGHIVNILYVDLPAPRPAIWRVRTLTRYWVGRYRAHKKQKHHLESSTAKLLPVQHQPITAGDAPDADVTIATWWETARWIQSWPQSKGAKAYFIRHHEIHGGDPSKVIETYRYPFQKLVIANWLKTLMADQYGDPGAVLIPNGVDWKQFNFQPREKRSTPTIGMLFGVVDWKGAKVAFNAIRLVQQRLPQLRVICFGAHPLDAVENPPDNFEYHFRPNQTDIPELYRMTDCWLIPSTIEGFGMPGLEAAACGCPLVSTRCGGPEDYIEHGNNGYLVDVDDVEAIANHIYHVVTMDPGSWRQMSCNSSDYVQRFDWDISAGVLEEALFNLIMRGIVHLDARPTSNIAE
jgi:glycosyltransferase involved in cell wall biosynthesis